MSASIAAEKIVDRTKADTGFIVAIVLLWGMGLVTLYIASGAYGQRMFKNPLYFVQRHVIQTLIGCTLLLFLSFTNLNFLRKFLPLIVFGGLILCLFTFIPSLGAEKNGARRWIIIGTFSLQPSELAKIIIPLFLANLFAKKQECINDLYASIGPALFFLFAYVLVILAQDDFSTAILILILGFFMLFAAGVKPVWLINTVLIMVPLSFIFIFTSPYRIRRLLSYANPAFDPQGAGFQVIKAKAAVSAGGFWGQDTGSPERFFLKIPEVQADFVFTGWAEEMGFLGVLAYFALLLYFSWRGFTIAIECRDRFRSLLALGATAAIFLQSLVNCGVVSGIFPPTGIPLPFFSAGGSSLLITMCLCGIIINVSRWNSNVEYRNE